MMPTFTQGAKDFGKGLERIAEDADPTNLAMSIVSKPGIESSGVFAISEGDANSGAINPGNKYQFSFMAKDGDR